MSGQGEAPRELTWAWGLVMVAAVFIAVAEQRTKKKVREAGEAVAAADGQKDHQFQMLMNVRNENAELRKFKHLMTPDEWGERTLEEVAHEIIRPQVDKLEAELGFANRDLDQLRQGKAALEAELAEVRRLRREADEGAERLLANADQREGELHWELDGPWENEVDAGKTTTPATGKTVLEGIDPENRRPS